MKRTSSFVAIAAAVSFGLVGCSGGGGDAQAFCDMQSELENFDPFAELDPTDAEASSDAMDQAMAKLDELADAAPDELSADMTTVREGLEAAGSVFEDAGGDPEAMAEAASELTEQMGELEEASGRLETWVSENCG